MQISYQWLKELTGLSWPVDDVAEKLTLCGIAAEEVISTAKHLKNVVVGEVLALAEVPGASKIRKATVNTGSGSFELICGAPNVAVGQKVPVALVGAVMANGMEIKKVTIRGVESSGMICSEAELGISNDHSGIMVLDPSAPIGKPLAEFLNFDDYIIGFEVTPNRGDALSAIGIARDMAALSVALTSPGLRSHCESLLRRLPMSFLVTYRRSDRLPAICRSCDQECQDWSISLVGEEEADNLRNQTNLQCR